MCINILFGLWEQMSTTLFKSHHFESLKITQVLPHLHSSRLLCWCSLGPLVTDIFSLPYLLDSLFTGTTRKLDKNLCQLHTSKGKDLTSNTSLRTIDQGTVMIKDIHDDGYFTTVRTIGYLDNTTNLNKAIEYLNDGWINYEMGKVPLFMEQVWTLVLHPRSPKLYPNSPVVYGGTIVRGVWHLPHVSCEIY